MSFDAWAARDGIGRAIRVDVSLDRFATISHRWGSSAGLLDGANMYSARILSLGNVRRGLGQQRVATSGSTDLEVDNADGALDGFVGRESIDTQAKARFRVYLVLFDVASPGAVTERQLGEFSLSEWPTGDNSTVKMQLADDVMGVLSQQAQLPTLLDWQAVGSTVTNPIKEGLGLPDSLGDGYIPIQLAFGEDWILAMPHLLPFGTVDAAYQYRVVVPICCTTDTGAGAAYEITNLRAHWFNGNTKRAQLIDIPRTVMLGGFRETVWTTERSPTIIKDGKSFKVIYAVVLANLGAFNPLNNYITGGGVLANDSGGYNPTYDSPQFSQEWADGYPPTAIYKMRSYAANDAGQGQFGNYAAGVLSWFAKGYPLSARTQQASPVQHACDVLKDLVVYYSSGGGAAVNESERLRVRAGSPYAACVGVIQPWTERANSPAVYEPPPSLRQAITRICQSSDIDVFVDWSGKFSFSSDVYDFATATQSSTLPLFVETQADAVQRRIPSEGERGAPFNRLFFTGGRPLPAEEKDIPYQGPFDWDLPGLVISLADRIVEASLEQGWRPWRQQALSPFYWRSLDVAARDRVRFRTNLRGLTLELGAYFKLTWTRGELAGPYSETVLQCESIALTADDAVEIEAVWRGDTVSERQYLLDDETLLIRTKNISGAKLMLEDGTPSTYDADSIINFVAMGVQAGDILLLRDKSQAEGVFSRNRAIRIENVNSSISLDIDPTDSVYGFPTPGILDDVAWEIYRGATTYHTAITDPTNYPSGGDMYGKMTKSDGTTTDSATGNRLVSG